MHTDLAFDDADLNGFVDGRIEPSRASALAESLASDPESSARIDAWRRQTDNLRTMFASVLSEPVPVRLLPTALPPLDAGRATGRDRERPPGRLAGAVATASIGMALIGFALGALASVGTDGFGLAPTAAAVPSHVETPEARNLATRAAEAHLTYLTDPSRPVEMAASEEAKLERWIGRRLDVGFHVPNLARQGWTFLGGRIVPGRYGPAAFLAYGSGTDRLGLTVSREALLGDGPAATTAEEAPRLGIATWADGDFGYALTADRGRDWLGRNVASLYDSVRAQVRAGGEDKPQP